MNQIGCGERSGKDRQSQEYNQLLRIEEELGGLAVYGYEKVK